MRLGGVSPRPQLEMKRGLFRRIVTPTDGRPTLPNALPIGVLKECCRGGHGTGRYLSLVSRASRRKTDRLDKRGLDECESNEAEIECLSSRQWDASRRSRETTLQKHEPLNEWVDFCLLLRACESKKNPRLMERRPAQEQPRRLAKQWTAGRRRRDARLHLESSCAQHQGTLLTQGQGWASYMPTDDHVRLSSVLRLELGTTTFD